MMMRVTVMIYIYMQDEGDRVETLKETKVNSSDQNVTKFFFPQKLNVVDAFKNFDGSEEEKNAMLGYITRAKISDRAFSSLGGYYVVPDEENKKLIITESIGEGEKKLFICHRCTDLTTLNNAKNIDSEEMKRMACNHSKLSQLLFGDLKVQTKPDKEKNVIDVVKDGKETIAIVFPSQDQARRPGVIHLTSRTRRTRCDISTNIVMYLQILSYIYF